MAVLLDYEGRSIRLTHDRLDHILEHPEMASAMEAIAATVAAPRRVLESLSDRNVRLYYRSYVSTHVGEKHLCVVVKLSAGDAFVLTAYLTDTIKKGRLIWPVKS